MLCPLNEKLKKIAAPVYVEAIKKSDEIVTALIKRSEELVEKGYHAQVLVTEDYFPLFWQARDNTRNALEKKQRRELSKPKTNRANLRLKNLPKLPNASRRDFRRASFCVRSCRIIFCRRFAISAARRKSPISRKVGEVYRILNRPVTPIFHRQSFTIIQPKHKRTLEKYDLNFKDLFQRKRRNFARNRRKLSETRKWQKYLPKRKKKSILQLKSSGRKFSSRSNRRLREVSPNRRRKIIYHIGDIRNKFHRAQIRKRRNDQPPHRNRF